jgi:hypothetical protein
MQLITLCLGLAFILSAQIRQPTNQVVQSNRPITKDTTVRLTPTQIDGLTGVVAVTHGAVLKSDGTVSALRATRADRTTVISLTPVQVDGLNGVAAVSGDMALKSDGTVWQFSSLQPAVQVSGLSDVAAIHESAGGVMALKRDGTVWAWWYPGTPGRPFEVIKARGAVAVAELAFGGLALMGDGTVWEFGLMKAHFECAVMRM